MFFRIPGSLQKPSLPWNLDPAAMQTSYAQDTPQERRRVRSDERREADMYGHRAAPTGER